MLLKTIEIFFLFTHVVRYLRRYLTHLTQPPLMIGNWMDAHSNRKFSQTPWRSVRAAKIHWFIMIIQYNERGELSNFGEMQVTLPLWHVARLMWRLALSKKRNLDNRQHRQIKNSVFIDLLSVYDAMHRFEHWSDDNINMTYNTTILYY